jgi:hypothetical protein
VEQLLKAQSCTSRALNTYFTLFKIVRHVASGGCDAVGHINDF